MSKYVRISKFSNKNIIFRLRSDLSTSSFNSPLSSRRILSKVYFVDLRPFDRKFSESSGASSPSKTSKLLLSFGRATIDVTKGLISVSKSGIRTIYDFSLEIIFNPRSIPGKVQMAWDLTKETAHHYWVSV